MAEGGREMMAGVAASSPWGEDEENDPITGWQGAGRDWWRKAEY